MAGRRKPISEINVVPYIDVMLVLLVIFMATAPLLTQGVIVDLPKAPSEPIAEQQDDPLVVSIRDDGAMFVNLGIQNSDDEGTRVTIYSLEDQAGKILRLPKWKRISPRSIQWILAVGVSTSAGARRKINNSCCS